MDKSFLIATIIQALADIVRVKLEHEITTQDLRQANDLIRELASNQEGMAVFLLELSKAVENLPLEEQRKILRCVAKIYKNMILFEEECRRIVQLPGKDK